MPKRCIAEIVVKIVMLVLILARLVSCFSWLALIQASSFSNLALKIDSIESILPSIFPSKKLILETTRSKVICTFLKAIPNLFLEFPKVSKQ
jgi:hypothetical protein